MSFFKGWVPKKGLDISLYRSFQLVWFTLRRDFATSETKSQTRSSMWAWNARPWVCFWKRLVRSRKPVHKKGLKVFVLLEYFLVSLKLDLTLFSARLIVVSFPQGSKSRTIYFFCLKIFACFQVTLWMLSSLAWTGIGMVFKEAWTQGFFISLCKCIATKGV